VGDTESSRMIGRLIEEAWNRGNLDVLDELVAEDAKPSNTSGPPGPATWKADIQYYRSRLGSLHYTVDDLFVCGDKAAARWTAKAVDTKGFLGGVASGQQVEFTGITIYRIRDNQFVDHWAEFDLAGLRDQLSRPR
jgi:predicted ester cyclase